MHGEMIHRGIVSCGESCGREVGSWRPSENVQFHRKQKSVFVRGKPHSERGMRFSKRFRLKIMVDVLGKRGAQFCAFLRFLYNLRKAKVWDFPLEVILAVRFPSVFGRGIDGSAGRDGWTGEERGPVCSGDEEL